MNCANGIIIKQHYNKYKSLGRAQRNTLANLIISKELATSHRISSERFHFICQEITGLFPNELKEIYYVPYNKYTKKLASGKLYAVYNYLKKKILSTSLPNSIAIPAEQLKPDEIEFLKVNTEPIELIFLNWKATTKYRNHLLKSITIDEYYKLFPSLQGPHGHLLLCEDFNNLYPGSITNLTDIWPTLNTNIQKIGRKRKINGDFDFELGGIALLPHILNTAYSRKRKSDARIKYSIKEISDAFFIILEVSIIYKVVYKILCLY